VQGLLKRNAPRELSRRHRRGSPPRRAVLVRDSPPGVPWTPSPANQRRRRPATLGAPVDDLQAERELRIGREAAQQLVGSCRSRRPAPAARRSSPRRRSPRGAPPSRGRPPPSAGVLRGSSFVKRAERDDRRRCRLRAEDLHSRHPAAGSSWHRCSRASRAGPRAARPRFRPQRIADDEHPRVGASAAPGCRPTRARFGPPACALRPRLASVLCESPCALRSPRSRARPSRPPKPDATICLLLVGVDLDEAPGARRAQLDPRRPSPRRLAVARAVQGRGSQLALR